MKRNRREFLKATACASGMATIMHQSSGCASLPFASSGQGGSMMGFKAPPLDQVRVGVIGVGNRGSGAIRRLPKIPHVEVRAISDLKQERVDKQLNALSKMGKPAPRVYIGASDSWKGICESDDIDFVYICTPWQWHTPMAVYAMKCGKHVGVEVPAASTVDECWELVETAEKTRRHCMMLSNSNYGEVRLFALNLCRNNVLGTLVHGEGAYIHDIRDSKLTNSYSRHWRLNWSREHTGNPYPTHGIGSLCQCMNINRGDKFEYLSSISSNQFGLTEGAVNMYGEGSPEAKATFRLGDMNTTMIRTHLGRTIMLQHDTTSPRPNVRFSMIAGTNGILQDYPLRVALRPKTHDWMPQEELEALKAKYGHPLWDKKNLERINKLGGHGGMDALMDLRLVHCLRNGLPLDMDVYDGALWSSLVELTERSVMKRGSSVNVPDFTRGGWRTGKPWGIVTL